ncbi:MAG: ATP-dependent Clp protease adaptor ClpS [Deltaproteobacteria bacterium]|nr:ATP-dependent Clp protease adaptor ClpS [Deltaproteobacteria bacterium]
MVHPSLAPRLGPEPPDKPDGGIKEEGQTATKPRTERPKNFKVLLHNDDFTTMEFVVEVLMSVFHRSKVEATRIMLSVHNSGKGVAGVYTREIAEAKATLAMDRARTRGYPLLVTTEPE